MSRRTAVCICNSLVHSPLSSLHNMIYQKGVVILCCVFLSSAVPIREEASGAASIVQHECEKDGEVYETDAQLNNTEEPCQLCYCQKGKLVCAVIQCYYRDDCEPHFVPGRCCPKYDHCPALGEKKDETLLPMTKMVEDDIEEFALGDDPSAYFAANSANSSSEEQKSEGTFETDLTSESVAQLEIEQILDLSKILKDILVESSTTKLENEGKNVGQPNLFEVQQEKILGGKDDNDSEITKDITAGRNEKLDYQNEEGEDKNIHQSAGEPNLFEVQQKEKDLDSKDGNDSASTEEMVVRSIVKPDYQDEEHEEENDPQNVRETQSSEYKESLESKQEYHGSSEVTNGERKVLEHQHEAQQDVQQNIGEQVSEMHPYKEQLNNIDNNHVRTVIQPDYQDDENEQKGSQQNVGEPDTSQYEDNKQNEQEYYDGTTDIITAERTEQDEESAQENDQQHIEKQDSSELNLNGESLQDENYNNGATEAVITDTNLNHQDEEEYKQENEQPMGEQASFETNLDGDGNNYDTTEIIATESYIKPDHQDERKPENQQNVEELHSSEIALEESLQSKEKYDGATEVMPVKKEVKLDYQDKHVDDQYNIGEPYSSENHYNEEEMHYGITEVAITERSMNLGSHSEENKIEKKQQDKGELRLSETLESKKEEDSKEKMGNALETAETTNTEKNPVEGTIIALTVGSHDVTELPYIAKQAEANGERMENEYTIYRSEFIEGPRGVHNGKLTDMEHKVYKEATTEDTDTPSKVDKNSTDENTFREKEPNDSFKLPYSEEGSGSNRLDDCAGGKEECAFLVKEWRILMPQLAMAPTPTPFDFWEYYDYSSSEVRPISYNDPEEVLILLPHPPQSDQNVAESLDNTAEFAMQHKALKTNHIL